MKANTVNVLEETITDPLKGSKIPRPIDEDDPTIPPRKSVDLSEVSPRPGGDYEDDVEIPSFKGFDLSGASPRPTHEDDPDIPSRKGVK
jgi:hypothetical protein